MAIKIKKIKTIQYILVEDDSQEPILIKELKNKIKEEKTFGNYESVDDFNICFKRSRKFNKILRDKFHNSACLKYAYDLDYTGDKVPHGSKYEGLNEFPKYILFSEDRDEFYDHNFIYGAKDLKTVKDLIASNNLTGVFMGLYDLDKKKSYIENFCL